MKRVFQHPPEPLTGKKYWRSLGELSDTPEFREWLEREFPAGASQLNDDEWSRRGFLKLMGASMALAGFGLNSCRRPEAHLVPFTKSAEWTIPGKFLYYATAMPRRTGAIPLIATTVDGRPIKLEGNPLHPASGGATDVFAQASILDLYDPSRSRRFVKRGKTSNRSDFEAYIDKLGSQMGGDGGAGLAFLVEETHSPTRERLRTELEKAFPKMRWCVYEAALSEAPQAATQTGFGVNTRIVPRLERADVVLALDSDFLDCGEGDIASVRGFTSRRRVTAAKDAMNRLYVVENRFTLTGSMADHRLRCPASQIPAFTYALAKKIAEGTSDAGLSSLLGRLTAPSDAQSFDEQWLVGAAQDLVAKGGTSLVLAGPHQPVAVHLLAYAMNVGAEKCRRDPDGARFCAQSEDDEPAATGRGNHRRARQTTFHFRRRPGFQCASVPGARSGKDQPAMDWADLQKKVPDVVRLGYHEDATSAEQRVACAAGALSRIVGRLAHVRTGAYLSIQPMIMPLFGGLSEIELMNNLLGAPKVEGPELVQETFRATKPPGDFQTAWSRFLRDGFAAHGHAAGSSREF